MAVVLILNRLMASRPLYRVADWLARTVLIYTLDVPAEKFNDDRLARTLDAINQHGHDIWQDVVHRALVQAEIDLSIIFYDLTAFVTHGDGSLVCDEKVNYSWVAVTAILLSRSNSSPRYAVFGRKSYLLSMYGGVFK